MNKQESVMEAVEVIEMNLNEEIAAQIEILVSAIRAITLEESKCVLHTLPLMEREFSEWTKQLD